jgi:probable phosphoglycerate mutase
MMKIYLTRHGQNEDNLNGILNGHRDLPLTDLGRDQKNKPRKLRADVRYF